MNRDQVPSAIDFSVNVFLAKTSFDGAWNVGFNMPIACMQIYVGGKVRRQFESDASIPGVKSPTRSNSRTRQCPRFDAAVSRREFERVESASGSYVAISGSRPQRAID